MSVIKFNIIKGDREKVYPVTVGSSIFEFLQLSIPPLFSYDILGDDLISDIDELETRLNIYKGEVIHKVLSKSLGIDKSDVKRPLWPVDFNNPHNVMHGANFIKVNIVLE